MTLCDRLLKQLEARGLSVAPGDAPGELKLVGPRSEVTPDLMAAVKEFKADLLVRVGKVEVVRSPQPRPLPRVTEDCRVCGRTVDDEDREVLRGVNPHCTEGGSPEVTDGTGRVHPASERCPYKDRQ